MSFVSTVSEIKDVLVSMNKMVSMINEIGDVGVGMVSIGDVLL